MSEETNDVIKGDFPPPPEKAPNDPEPADDVIKEPLPAPEADPKGELP